MSAETLLSNERLDAIRERIRTEGRVVAAVLAVEFGVSEDTVRRDLRALAAEGHCERVYGGAIRPRHAPTTLRRRMGEASEAKQRLGRLAASLTESGQTVFIDAGSTNLEIARHLPRDRGLTVVTNAPSVAEALSDQTGVEISMVGGRFDPRLGSCLGGQTVEWLERLFPDIAFIGTCGLSLEAGLSAFSAEEAALKRIVAARTRRLVVAVTGEKLGLSAPFQISGTETVSHLVTDDPDHPLCRELAELGASIISETRSGNAASS
ncbi:MAG: DeoR/GlpR family DNA-binding transcription regulator [Pseudomonadota bacterium]|nr:DeoR/GlpR family DNA-binding transcription regulator [Pseudomonadota bacterium]